MYSTCRRPSYIDFLVNGVGRGYLVAVIGVRSHGRKCARISSGVGGGGGNGPFIEQYAVKAQTSLAPLSCLAGSRGLMRMRTNIVYSELCEDCTVANKIDYEIDYAWACIHDNGHMITACDVLL